MFERFKAKRLLSALEDAPAGVAEEFKALGDAGVDALVEGLRHPSPAVRESAVRILGELGPPRAIQPLAGCAGDLPAARSALMAIASRAVRPRVLRAVRASGGTAASTLVALLAAAEPAMRSEAEAALTREGARAVPALLAASETEELGEPALRVLAKAGPDGTAALVSLLQHKKKEVRRHAAQALESVDWRPASPSEEAALAAARQDWQRCRNLGEPAVEPLSALLADSDSEIRQAAARALGALGSARATPALIAGLEDRKDTVRLAAIEALGAGGDPRAIEPLAACVRGSYDLRAPALQALEKIGWNPERPADRVLRAVLLNDSRALADPDARNLLIEAACELDYTSLPEDVIVRGLGMLGNAEQELLRVVKRGGQPAATAQAMLNEHRAEEDQFVLCPACLAFAGIRKELREAGGRLHCRKCGARIAVL